MLDADDADCGVSTEVTKPRSCSADACPILSFLPTLHPPSPPCRMPPKTKDLASIPEDAVLGLQDWLKLLSSHGVSMRTGMALAAKG